MPVAGKLLRVQRESQINGLSFQPIRDGKMLLLTMPHKTTSSPEAFPASRRSALAIAVVAILGLTDSASAATKLHLIEHSTTDAITDLVTWN